MNWSTITCAPFAKSPNCASHSTSASGFATEYPYSNPTAANSLSSESYTRNSPQRLERRELRAGPPVDQHRVPLAERPPPGVLPGQPDRSRRRGAASRRPAPRRATSRRRPRPAPSARPASHFSSFGWTVNPSGTVTSASTTSSSVERSTAVSTAGRHGAPAPGASARPPPASPTPRRASRRTPAACVPGTPRARVRPPRRQVAGVHQAFHVALADAPAAGDRVVHQRLGEATARRPRCGPTAGSTTCRSRRPCGTAARNANASRATRTQASGSSPFTWKIGAWTIRATSLAYSDDRAYVEPVVNPSWLFTTTWTVPPVR